MNQKVTFGGWYQRTTLHLTELYDFFSEGNSKLNLSKELLQEYHKKLDLNSVKREVSYLEYIEAITNSGIKIKYYEDGLYILEKESDDLDGAVKLINGYFNDCFNPAVNYIFSLGAPTPKILSNIKEVHPIVVTKIVKNPNNYVVDKKFGKIYSEIRYKDLMVYKMKDYIFIISSNESKGIQAVIEMQIFFREFKDQLHKYLNIHRNIWEEISEIKDKRYIKGKEVLIYRTHLESYKKTIDLIGNRINQMSSYANTRASLANNLNVEKELVIIFRYRFEDLLNTLNYVKEIWKMTLDYVASAIALLVEIDNKNNLSGIKSIQFLASVGVVTAIVGYLTKDTLPSISKIGLVYFGILCLAVFCLDFIIRRYSKNKRYELKFVEREKGF